VRFFLDVLAGGLVPSNKDPLAEYFGDKRPSLKNWGEIGEVISVPSRGKERGGLKHTARAPSIDSFDAVDDEDWQERAKQYD